MELWNKCSEKLENKLSQEDFNTWIRPLKATQEENTLELLAPNDFIKEYIRKNLDQDFRKYIEKASGLKNFSLTYELENSFNLLNLKEKKLLL